MRTRFFGAACVGVFTFAVSASASAALVSRLSGQAVYDTDLNVTWLADANLAASNTFGVNGVFTGGIVYWSTAQSWIGAMNAANYLGFNDWRLPTTLQPDPSCSIQGQADGTAVSYGYNCTGSEMGHLFYNELGGVAGSSITTTHNANYNLFSNIQSYKYWSGTEYVLFPSLNAYFFDFGYLDVGGGNENWTSKGSDIGFAWAMRTGDVAAVPLPATVWLFGSGLLGLLGMARRNRIPA